MGHEAVEENVILGGIGKIVGVVVIGVIEPEELPEVCQTGVHRITAQADDPRIRQCPMNKADVEEVHGQLVHEACRVTRGRTGAR